jgi:hypothetical protein
MQILLRLEIYWEMLPPAQATHRALYRACELGLHDVVVAMLGTAPPDDKLAALSVVTKVQGHFS